MNGEEGNTEYLSLKSLLQQWKLSHLLQYFMAQNMTVDVLKMMKVQHIFELLQNFTCGDRIRFEYELEKWRLSIGKPLSKWNNGMPMTMPSSSFRIGSSSSSSCIPNGSIVSKAYNATTGRDCETQTQLSHQPKINSNNEDAFFNFQHSQSQFHQSHPPQSNLDHHQQQQQQQQQQHQQQKTASLSPLQAPATPPLLLPPVSNRSSTCPVQLSSSSSSSTSSKQTAIYSPRVRINSPTLLKDHHARGRPCAAIIAKQMSYVINAREILERCRPRGIELMKIYETNKRFRPVERVELINLYAHYFYEHNIHLPVKLSYELERQILKLFPGERLKDYRTEKRGKIYIRLSNIKNNRRRSREAKAAIIIERDKITNDDDNRPNTTMNPNDVCGEDNETINDENDERDENSNSSYDKPLKIYANDIKHETEIDFGND